MLGTTPFFDTIMRTLSIFLLLLVLISCELQYKELQYPQEVDFFDSNFYQHFPTKVPSAYSQLTVSQNLSNSHPHIWLLYYDSDEHLDSLETALNSNFEAYLSEDTCLTVIEEHLNPNNLMDYDKSKYKPKIYKYKSINCHETSPPIPRFYSDSWFQTNSTKTGLNPGWKLYVIEADTGTFMKDEKLPNGFNTPNGFKHGISKGIALNRETNAIIYWADVW
ncbi:MAG: hypothetical protein RLO17_19760 [Cyclobacteriaceae bacterium]